MVIQALIGPFLTAFEGMSASAASAAASSASTAATTAGIAAGSDAAMIAAGAIPSTIPAAGAAGAMGVAGKSLLGGFGAAQALDMISALEDNTEAVKLAQTAYSGVQSGFTSLANPASAILGVIDQGVNASLQKDAAATDISQGAVDFAWNISGQGFIEKIPIIGTFHSIFKDIVDSVIQLPRAITQWADALVGSQLKLARFNGELAAVAYEKEYRDITRDIESAGRTSGSTKELSDAVNDLKDEMQPRIDDITMIMNSVLVQLIDFVPVLLEISDRTWAIASSPWISGVIGVSIQNAVDEARAAREEDKKTAAIPWQDLMADIIAAPTQANPAPNAPASPFGIVPGAP